MESASPSLTSLRARYARGWFPPFCFQVPAKQLGKQECSNMLPANMRSSCASWLPNRLLVIATSHSCISSSEVISRSSGRSTLYMSLAQSSGTDPGTAVRAKAANCRSRSRDRERLVLSSACKACSFARTIPAMQSTRGLHGCMQSSSQKFVCQPSLTAAMAGAAKSSTYARRLCAPSVQPRKSGDSESMISPAFNARRATKYRPFRQTAAPMPAVLLMAPPPHSSAAAAPSALMSVLGAASNSNRMAVEDASTSRRTSSNISGVSMEGSAIVRPMAPSSWSGPSPALLSSSPRGVQHAHTAVHKRKRPHNLTLA
mmetsp:Transcript_115392/g.203673  ORF Transcript_115392/g.203673 Transcript_115392/m.203673 type:complete len:315 (-) Transcript_115392:3-947(-)